MNPSHVLLFLGDTTKSYLLCYTNPFAVFKQFNFKDFLNTNAICVFESVSRLKSFLDPLIKLQELDHCKSSYHVHTMGIKIIQHLLLLKTMLMDLNHILLQLIDFREAIEVAIDAFEQLYAILHLQGQGLALQNVVTYLRPVALDKLQEAAKHNKFGFKASKTEMILIPAI